MKSEKLQNALGNIRDEYIVDAGKYRSKDRKYRLVGLGLIICILILCFMTVPYQSYLSSNIGVVKDTEAYVFYAGPVLPMTLADGEQNLQGLTVERKVTYDFAPYDYRWRYRDLVSLDNSNLDKNAYTPATIITDHYRLYNTADEDITYSILYPVTAAILNESALLPSFTLNGENLAGDFLLSQISYKDSVISFRDFEAMMNHDDAFTALASKVTVYELSDLKIPEDVAVDNVSCSIEFKTQAGSSYYGFGFDSYEFDEGSVVLRKTRCNKESEMKATPYDGTCRLLVFGEIGEFETHVWEIDSNSELADASFAVTVNEASTEESLSFLAGLYAKEWLKQYEGDGEDVILEHIKEDALIALMVQSAASVMLTQRDEPFFMIDECFGQILYDRRILYEAFDLTLLAGQSVELDAQFIKNASLNYGASRKGENYYDLATKLGSNIEFAKVSAGIKNDEFVTIADNNFGFNQKDGVREVELDLKENCYYMKVYRKKQ